MTKKYSFCSRDCIQQKELLQGFIKKSPKLIYAEMFGFRFSDSNYITIQCEVGILPKYTSKVHCDFAISSVTIMISNTCIIFKSLKVIAT